MANAFLTAIEQQIRLQKGRCSLREPTHWIITTFCPFAGQALSCSRFSSSTCVKTPAERPYKNSEVLAGRARGGDDDGAAGHFERLAALDQREMEFADVGL